MAVERTQFGYVEGGPQAGSPMEAIREALISAQTVLGLRYTGRLLSDSEADRQLLTRHSEDRCRFGSFNALMFLYQNYSHLFEYMFGLQSERAEGESFRRNPDWNFHAFFLVRDMQGRWYTASPGNYTAEQLNSGVDRVYAGNLEGVIGAIEVTDSGRWPTPGFIRIATGYGITSPRLETLIDGKQVGHIPIVRRRGDTQQMILQRFNIGAYTAQPGKSKS